MALIRVLHEKTWMMGMNHVLHKRRECGVLISVLYKNADVGCRCRSMFCTIINFESDYGRVRGGIRKSVKHENCRNLSSLSDKTEINSFGVLVQNLWPEYRKGIQTT